MTRESGTTTRSSGKNPAASNTVSSSSGEDVRMPCPALSLRPEILLPQMINGVFGNAWMRHRGGAFAQRRAVPGVDLNDDTVGGNHSAGGGGNPRTIHPVERLRERDDPKRAEVSR
jgi:hypothetical protein